LLWQYNDEQVSLYFSGKCTDVARLHFNLCQTHIQVTGGWLHYNTQLEHLQKIENNLAYTSGLLAQGPRKLLTAYAGCLERNGLDYSIIHGYHPKGEPKKVLLFYDGYVVAEEFSFSKVEG